MDKNLKKFVEENAKWLEENDIPLKDVIKFLSQLKDEDYMNLEKLGDKINDLEYWAQNNYGVEEALDAINYLLGRLKNSELVIHELDDFLLAHGYLAIHELTTKAYLGKYKNKYPLDEGK